MGWKGVVQWAAVWFEHLWVCSLVIGNMTSRHEAPANVRSSGRRGRSVAQDWELLSEVQWSWHGRPDVTEEVKETFRAQTREAGFELKGR